MQIIFLLFPLFTVQDVNLTPLPAFRLINLTLRHGLSPLGKLLFDEVYINDMTTQSLVFSTVSFNGFHSLFCNTRQNGEHR